MSFFFINKASEKDTTHLKHVVCEYCDLLLDDVDIPPHYDLSCPRCKAVLYHNRADTLSREYALVITGLMLFWPAIFLPMVIITPFGSAITVNMMDGVLVFLKQGDPIVASITLWCAIAAPFLDLFLLFLVITCIYLDRLITENPYGLGTFFYKNPISYSIRKASSGNLKDYGVMFFRWYKKIHPWAMLEVYLLGFVITFTNVDKMASAADAQPGYGFYAFIGVMLATLLSSVTLNTQLVWQILDKRCTQRG
jgi:paraquat-inducible protein A